MSRVGKLPVPVPNGVKCELNGSHLKVTGPKGALEHTFRPEVVLAIEDGAVVVRRQSDRPAERALHGLSRALIANMVTGVTQGYERELNIVGVGYRAAMQGKSITFSLGYSHPIVVEPPAGVTFVVEGTTVIKVSGIDKQLVGQTAANIRALRKPEPYKGKGVKYANEKIRRKAGKSGGK